MYNHMEHYSAHHDFFDPAAYASNPEMLASVEHGAKNRLAVSNYHRPSNKLQPSPHALHTPHTTSHPTTLPSPTPTDGLLLLE